MGDGGRFLPRPDRDDAQHSLEDLKTTARMTGEVLGPREAQRAAEFVRYFDENIRRVTDITGKLSASERPKVLHTASAGILHRGWTANRDRRLITVAGGVNAADVVATAGPSPWNRWPPGILMSSLSARHRTHRADRRFSTIPRWRDIKAVRDSKVFVNPSGAYLWDRHSAEAALQVLWAAKTLHPTQFATLDVRQETRSFYARFFHYTLTEKELDSILNSTPP